MDLIKTLYLQRHNGVHTGLRRLLEPLSEAQVRCRPHEAVNTIAWLVWHVARAEDIAINRLVTDGVQVLEERWTEDLNVRIRHFGVGMTPPEVLTLSNQINLAAMRGYFDAVRERTVQVVDAMDSETLTEVVDAPYIHKVVYDEGIGGAEAAYVESVWHDLSRGNYLMYLGLTHSFAHHGEAQTVRSLMGIR